MKGEAIVDFEEIEYNGDFSVEERKAMTAEMLRELRKSKKLSQKEVAGKLNIPATTYNTYESGRTEPPIEILVRLSYLYKISVDLLVQRNRTYKTTDDIGKQMANVKDELVQLGKEYAESGKEIPGITDFFATLNKLADAMTAYSQTEAAQKAINNHGKKD